MRATLEFLKWPVTFGLLLGIAVMLFSISRQQGQSAARPLHENNKLSAGLYSYANAVRQARPSVVNIYTRSDMKRKRHPLFDDPLFRHFFNSADIPRQQRMQSALGSGVIISEDGYLVTNNHVIRGAEEIIVQLVDGREGEAELIGADEKNDIAVLRISLDNLAAIPIGNAREAQVGDVVLAIGNPFGMGQTVTQGIISATGRFGLGVSTFENFIQTDAAINPGNSGGALIDAKGHLLGINTAILNKIGDSDLEGVGLAVPVHTATQVLEDILKFGQVIRGWLGVTAQAITPQLANRYRLPSIHGVLVTAIYTDGPAHRAGMLAGDVIYKINDRIVTNGLRTIQKIQESRPGETIDIEVYRDGQPVELMATLGARPAEG